MRYENIDKVIEDQVDESVNKYKVLLGTIANDAVQTQKDNTQLTLMFLMAELFGGIDDECILEFYQGESALKDIVIAVAQTTRVEIDPYTKGKCCTFDRESVKDQLKLVKEMLRPLKRYNKKLIKKSKLLKG